MPLPMLTKFILFYEFIIYLCRVGLLKMTGLVENRRKPAKPVQFDQFSIKTPYFEVSQFFAVIQFCRDVMFNIWLI
jgi:hypothetical protein